MANSPFYFKAADNALGFVKVSTHPDNRAFMLAEGWVTSRDEIASIPVEKPETACNDTVPFDVDDEPEEKPKRRRRTKKEMEAARALENGDSSAGD